MPEVLAVAPTRVDLAGGTLDIWPISLLEEPAATVNVAVDLPATARVRPRADGMVRLVSRDQGVEETYPGPGSVKTDGKLGLLGRLVRELPPPGGVDLLTDCAAPAGSGLGGSSALGIATAAALARHRGEDLSSEALLGLVQAVETRVLRVPTGVQDYYPALIGGLLSIRYGVRGTRAERIPADLRAMEEQLVLCFSGASRSSGISNWDMVKRYLDGDETVRRGIARVGAATRKMESALSAGHWDEAGEALGEEWEARKTLSAKVSGPEIETQMAAARRAGAVAGKVCGAGGGGCIVFLTRPGRKADVERALAGAGARVLPARLREEGLRLEVSDIVD
jgi:D-glycero-alpha-D-manno-heptose-7-phosphate kinase